VSLLEIALMIRVYSCEEEDVGDDHHSSLYSLFLFTCVRDVTRKSALVIFS
jgi:hypothetical protein